MPRTSKAPPTNPLWGRRLKAYRPPRGSVNLSRRPLDTKGLALNPVATKADGDTVQILIGSITLGTVRIEWFNAMQGMVCPPNWAVVRSTPTGFLVPDGQNILVDTMLRGKFRALLLIEDDTCPPPDTLIRMDTWFWKMERRQAPPVVSGLYHIKGSAEIKQGKTGGIKLLGPEPLAYRGSGNRAYRDWKPNDIIWVSGVPTGALLIHRSVLEAWAKEPDVETYTLQGYPYPLKRIFQNPSHVWVDPTDGGVHVVLLALDLPDGGEHGSAVGDIEAPRGHTGNAGQLRHRRIVDVARDDARPGRGGSAGQGPADAVGAASDDDHISCGLKPCAHRLVPLSSTLPEARQWR